MTRALLAAALLVIGVGSASAQTVVYGGNTSVPRYSSPFNTTWSNSGFVPASHLTPVVRTAPSNPYGNYYSGMYGNQGLAENMYYVPNSGYSTPYYSNSNSRARRWR